MIVTLNSSMSASCCVTSSKFLGISDRVASPLFLQKNA
jgi:hypothetical protein